MLTKIMLNLEQIFMSSPVLGLGVSFLAGLLVCFSPCIYPLIPITVGVVGAAAESSRAKGFFLSLVFVLGISVSYTVMGILAAMFGIFFATLFVNPITYFILAGLFFVLAFHLFDVIKLNLFCACKRQCSSNGTIWSLFVLGLFSGLAIIPCNFPVLGAILGVISLKGSVLYGAAALFLFSLGYGSLLIVLGTFTSLVRKLPQSGNWLVVIKRVLGGVLFSATHSE